MELQSIRTCTLMHIFFYTISNEDNGAVTPVPPNTGTRCQNAYITVLNQARKVAEAQAGLNTTPLLVL